MKWLKRNFASLFAIVALLMIFVMPFASALAQEAAQVAPQVLESAPSIVAPPTEADWTAFLTALGGIKGLGTLGLIAVIVQGLMIAIKLNVGKLEGKIQILLVTFLTLIGGVIALKASGMEWQAVLVHSSTLAAVQVFLHQLYKQFVEKKA